MLQTQLQVDRLKRLYATKRSARVLLNYAAKQTSTANGLRTTVDALHQLLYGEERPVPSRRELISALRAFAQAGCGRFFNGRHGQPSRFIWAAPLGAIGAAVIGATSSSVPSKNSPARIEVSPSESSMISHPFRLRPKLVVSMTLPSDLTGAEADRLAKFIQALPLVA
jgi:hypothetical protein